MKKGGGVNAQSTMTVIRAKKREVRLGEGTENQRERERSRGRERERYRVSE